MLSWWHKDQPDVSGRCSRNDIGQSYEHDNPHTCRGAWCFRFASGADSLLSSDRLWFASMVQPHLFSSRCFVGMLPVEGVPWGNRSTRYRHPDIAAELSTRSCDVCCISATRLDCTKAERANACCVLMMFACFACGGYSENSDSPLRFLTLPVCGRQPAALLFLSNTTVPITPCMQSTDVFCSQMCCKSLLAAISCGLGPSLA
ncbi:hypothetical protein QBC36DRAFT_142088 [Triangularia setosa]|uniref:Uncharacterized protein n=1 Tax=Triangularia setosa TaxID=2587417 RepID=A0AAN6WA91_9PEZI|nr:hypothetical protein QBC36DRAFT_142088 [Podospora setosa]